MLCAFMCLIDLQSRIPDYPIRSLRPLSAANLIRVLRGERVDSTLNCKDWPFAKDLARGPVAEALSEYIVEFSYGLDNHRDSHIA